MVSSSLSQFGTPRKGAGPRLSAKGRVCQASGCSTVLSIYNDLPLCSSHEAPRVRRPLQRR
jgi:hypothetical protein